jgi:ubiquitin C-terminal hydrolase
VKIVDASQGRTRYSGRALPLSENLYNSMQPGNESPVQVHDAVVVRGRGSPPAYDAMEEESPEAIETLYRGLALDKGQIAPGSHQKLTLQELKDHADLAFDVAPHVRALESIFQFPEAPTDGGHLVLDDYAAAVRMALEPEYAYLIGTAVPSLVRTVLGKHYLPQSEYAMANQFLQHVCALTVGLLKQDHIELCNTLSRIFDGDRAFYSDYSYTSSTMRRRSSSSPPGEILPGVDGVGRCADPDDEIMSLPSMLNLEEFTRAPATIPGEDTALEKDVDEEDDRLLHADRAALKARSAEILEEAFTTAAPNVHGASPGHKEAAAPKDPCFASAENNMFASERMIANINYFGRLGGFDALATQISRVSRHGTDIDGRPDTQFSFDVLARVIEPIIRTRDVLVPETAVLVAPVLRQAIDDRCVAGLCDADVRASDVDDALQLVEQLSLFLHRTVSADDVPTITAPMEVHIAVRFMQSNSLEKRLDGLNHITQKVVKTHLAETRRKMLHTDHSGENGENAATPPRASPNQPNDHPLSVGRRRYKSTCMDPARMVDFLLDKCVVEELFGASMHIELINRAHDILKFLAVHDALTESHLELIWDSGSGAGQHVSRVTAVHRCILAISSDLSDKMLTCLISVMDSIETIDLNLLNLLCRLAVTAGNARGVLESVLTLMWRFYCGPQACEEKSAELIRREMVNLMTRRAGQAIELPLMYCEQCIEQIQRQAREENGESVQEYHVLRALKLIQEIIESVNESACSLLERLEQEHGLTQLLVTDLSKYQRQAYTVAATMLTTMDQETKDTHTKLPVPRESAIGTVMHTSTFVGKEDHSKQLFHRLRTLLFVLNNGGSRLRLGLSETTKLFVTGLECAVTSYDLNLLMQFFCHAVDLDCPEKRYVDVPSAEYIFNQLNSAAMPFSAFDMGCVKCYIAYFRFQNIRTGTLVSECALDEYADSDDGSSDEARNDWRVSATREPEGLQTLWKIILNTKSEEVQSYCTKFYNSMHLELAPQFQVHRDDTDGQSESRGTRKHRSTRLLRVAHIVTCLKQFEYAQAMYTHGDASGDVDPTRQAVAARNTKICSFVLQEFIASATKAEMETDHHRKQEESYYGDKIGGSTDHNKDDEPPSPSPLSRIPSFGGSSNNNPSSPRSGNQTVSLSQLERTSLRPTSILAEDDHFNVLFQMLNLDNPEMSSPVFSLLQKLPCNHEEIQRMLDLEHDLETEVFPTKYLFRTMYSLRIMNEFLATREGDETDLATEGSTLLSSATDKEKALWTMKFSARGGVDVLLGLLRSCVGMSCGMTRAVTCGGEYFGPVDCARLVIQAIALVLSFNERMDTLVSKSAQFNASMKMAFCVWKNATVDSVGDEARKDGHSAQSAEDLGRVTHEAASCISIDHARGFFRTVANLLAQFFGAGDGELTKTKQLLLFESFILIARMSAKYPGAMLSSLSNKDEASTWRLLLEGVFLQALSASCRPLRKNIGTTLNSMHSDAIRRHLLVHFFVPMLPAACTMKDGALDNRSVQELFWTLSTMVFKMPAGTEDQKILFDLMRSTVASIENLDTFETTIEVETAEVVDGTMEPTSIRSTDFRLAGLLMLLRHAVANRPELAMLACVECNVGELLMTSWLYTDLCSNEAPKCKSKMSRENGFELARQLTNSLLSTPESMVTFRTSFVPHLSMLQQKAADGRSREEGASGLSSFTGENLEGRSSMGYVGLLNPGCICYMISVLQQLFMNQHFRDGILRFNSSIIEDKRESVLYQLQNMFVWLQHSHRKAYLPVDFCHAFKDWDGNPTNLYVQQDADEFLKRAFDQIEGLLKGSRQETLVEDNFGGKLVNQIICTPPPNTEHKPYVSEREEKFPMLTLEVKGKKHISESLQAYVEGDLLTGDNAYFCEQYNQKVPATKRVCIRDLPNTLILHLKRFEFDFDMMMNAKVNDYCEFPEELNMFPFTEEGLQAPGTQEADLGSEGAENEASNVASAGEAKRPASYYEYMLAGVVVHVGTIDSGHYYSLIRDKSQESGGGTERPQWCRFNDHMVSAFDFSAELADECFGGTEAVLGEYGRSMYREKSKNAYMLIYQRRERFENDIATESDAASASETEDMEDAPALDCVTRARSDTDASDGTPTERLEIQGPKTASPRSILAMKELSVELSGLAENAEEQGAMSVTSTSSNIQLAQPVGPPSLVRRVQEDNEQLMRDQISYDPRSFYQIACLLSGALSNVKESREKGDGGDDGDTTEKSILLWLTQFSMSYFFRTVLPVLDKYPHLGEEATVLVTQFFRLLSDAFKETPAEIDTLFRLLRDDPDWALHFLLLSPHRTIRKETASFLQQLVLHYGQEMDDVIEEEGAALEIKKGDDDDDDDDALTATARCTMYKEQLGDFYDNVIAGLFKSILGSEILAKQWRSFHEYFTLVNDMCTANYELKLRCLADENQILPRLLDFLLWERSPCVTDSTSRRVPMGNSQQTPDFSPVIDVVQTLVCSCARYVPAAAEDESGSERRWIPPATFPPTLTRVMGSRSDEVPMFDDLSLILLVNEELVELLLENSDTSIEAEACWKILIHSQHGSWDTTEVICATVLREIRVASHSKLTKLLDLIEMMLALDDEHRTERVHALLNPRRGLICVANLFRSRDHTRTFAIIRSIFRWSKGEGAMLDNVAEFMAAEKDSVEWMQEWFASYMAAKERSLERRRGSPRRRGGSPPPAPGIRSAFAAPPYSP